ncbi:MAG TPA: cytochrome c [Acidobacteriaceae bacterium]|nr:cytochrome c [Acidobacteriaceae bacterium]
MTGYREPWQRLGLAGAMGLLLLAAGCRQDMQNQPRMFPQRGSSVFADGRSVRPQVEHTVARGQLYETSDYFYTGLMNGKESDTMPFPVTMQVLARGQERFNVYCTPCHSRVGNGLGMIVERGFKPAGNLHDPRRLAEPLSHYFYVMTNGYGAMPDYKAQVAPADRWAIAAYIRALQLSENAKVSDVPPGAQVQDLKDIATQQGEPASFAGPWPTPSTAVYGSPIVGIVAGAPAENPPKPAVKPEATTTRPAATGAQR